MMEPLDHVRVGAAVMLLAIIGAALLYWPLPALGVANDPATGVVLAVADSSAGARAGVRVGDQIVAFYGHPWSSFNSRLLIVPLPWRHGTPSPMTIRRDGQLLALTLQADRPELPLQVDKALHTLVALVCWATGVALGGSRQRNNRQLQWAAWFWVLLGGALGVLPLVDSVSYVLTAGILWVLVTLLAPTAVMMHLWYPSRPVAPTTRERARRWWLIAIGVLQLAALGLAAISGTTTGLLERLDTSTTVVFLVCFALSALMLGRAYRTTTIAHIRRQIRLIAATCVVVACTWATLLLGEVLAPQLIVAIPPVTLTVVAALVPLAYVYGGISADLLRVDVFAQRVGAHACTLVAILVLVTVVTQLGLLTPTPMLVVVIVLAGYQPVFQLIRRLERVVGAGERPAVGLSQTMARLGSTLDAEKLAVIIGDGLQAAFREPPVAVYLRRDLAGDVLERTNCRRFELPQIVTIALVGRVFQREETLLPIGAVQQRVTQEVAEGQDDALVFAPMINLLGIIRNAKGVVLGLVVLGPRGDLDPYREQDLRAMNQLLTAASLAFTNSASYVRQVQAQELIRRLYQHLQQAQDQTASMIARELHDEVLNVNVRLNMDTLEKLLAQARTLAPELRDELQALLESEQSTGTLLRLICEQLRPAYTDDPLGLVISLRRAIERLRTTWDGVIRLDVERPLVPVDHQLHRELVMIAREGVANAIKHAGASEIVVTVQFPSAGDEPLILTITDNGPTREKVASKAGHLGLPFMRESADAVGATINWLPRETGGIEVRVVAPFAGRQDDPLLAAVPAWWDDEAGDGDERTSGIVAMAEDSHWDRETDKAIE